ncbi:MAG: DUF3267 domain-containing protein [Anaerolineae bacterium]|nr:DUF3267 domain-containing protein [Anaerolineae bacterium]
MRATKTLPENYHARRTVDFSHNLRLAIGANLAGILLIFVFGTAAMRIVGWIRPDIENLTAAFGDTGDLRILFIALVVIALLLVVHELVHGLFFWLFTRARPVFGFKGVYAYAGAPQWFLPRNDYFVVALAPLVILTLVCVAWLPVVPPAGVSLLVLAGVANAAGAVGDILIAVWLLTYPKETLVRDTGAGITFYGP